MKFRPFDFFTNFFSPNFVEIEDLPPTIQEQLYSELMDRDAQKELEEEAAIINWSEEVRVRNKYFVKLKITVLLIILLIFWQVRLGSRLHALWNRSAGDCLLDSVLQVGNMP